MRYSRAVKLSVLKKVLPPDEQSIPQVSRETGIHNQTIRNWVQKCESGILPEGLQESSARFKFSIELVSGIVSRYLLCFVCCNSQKKRI